MYVSTVVCDCLVLAPVCVCRVNFLLQVSFQWHLATYVCHLSPLAGLSSSSLVDVSRPADYSVRQTTPPVSPNSEPNTDIEPQSCQFNPVSSSGGKCCGLGCSCFVKGQWTWSQNVSAIKPSSCSHQIEMVVFIMAFTSADVVCHLITRYLPHSQHMHATHLLVLSNSNNT